MSKLMPENLRMDTGDKSIGKRKLIESLTPGIDKEIKEAYSSFNSLMKQENLERTLKTAELLAARFGPQHPEYEKISNVIKVTEQQLLQFLYTSDGN